MHVLAVADVALQSEVSAALPIAAYALTRYRTQWSVRIPTIAGATVGAIIAASDTWGPHTGFIISVAFVLWPATLGAYVPARAQLVAALRERAERAEADQELREQQAVFTERVRIAGEMHDVVGHRVSLMVLHAGAVEMAAGDPARHVLAEQMQIAGRQALQELRQCPTGSPSCRASPASVAGCLLISDAVPPRNTNDQSDDGINDTEYGMLWVDYRTANECLEAEFGSATATSQRPGISPTEYRYRFT